MPNDADDSPGGRTERCTRGAGDAAPRPAGRPSLRPLLCTACRKPFTRNKACGHHRRPASQTELQIHQERLRAAASATERLASRCNEAERDNEALLKRLDELGSALQVRAAAAASEPSAVLAAGAVSWKAASQRRTLSERRPPPEASPQPPQVNFAAAPPRNPFAQAEAAAFATLSSWNAAQVAAHAAAENRLPWPHCEAPS